MAQNGTRVFIFSVLSSMFIIGTVELEISNNLLNYLHELRRWIRRQQSRRRRVQSTRIGVWGGNS